MHIVCSTDANYVMPTGVMIKSASINNADADIQFHILIDESVNGMQKDELEKVVKDNARHEVVFHLIDGSAFDGFPQLGITKTYITKATYYRLLFTEIFSADIHKLLYLDGDMIITSSLTELWKEDLHGYAVGAVTDMSEAIHDYHRLGYDAELGYFNAGMLLVNLDYWREHYVKDLFLDVINHHPERIKYHDQDVLNIVFCRAKKMLPFKYNFQDGFMYKAERMEMNAQKYAGEIKDAIAHHAIIHYTSTAKPWHKECLNPFKAEWWKVLAKTSWVGYKPVRRFPYSRWRKAIGDILRFLHMRPQLTDSVFPYIDIK